MRLPNLPQLLSRKIYKTGQTRGADDDEIFQNRVGRNSTVLIPFSQFQYYFDLLENGFTFENGYIVLISPDDFFSDPAFSEKLESYKLEIGKNALIFYQIRTQWVANNPEDKGFEAAQSRVEPLGGSYLARISATTAIENGHKIVAGFNTTSSKGAGIRVYEYASSETIKLCRQQLEALFWLCGDADDVAKANGMSSEAVDIRKKTNLEECEANNLLDFEQLISNRMVNQEHRTICPLCLEELSAGGFFAKMEQALGREVHDLTITQLNLFHIKELRFGMFNHRPYNLGWGHHHCNVVVKDAGIDETVDWMRQIVQKNEAYKSITEN